MDITQQLQYVLVKRWAEASFRSRRFSYILTTTLKKWSKTLMDNLCYPNPLLRILKTKGSVK